MTRAFECILLTNANRMKDREMNQIREAFKNEN